MKNTIGHLKELQKVDSKIFDLEVAKGDLPEKVNRLKIELEDLKIFVEEKSLSIVEFKKERKLKEGELKLTEEKLKKHQNQLYDVTTNKEYDAITQEIEHEKENISSFENRILELIASEEAIEKELEQDKESVETIQNELKEKETELRKLEKANEDEEITLLHEREKILVRLDKHILNSYRRILAAKNNLAVVPVTREACGGCFNRIPPQRIVEVRKMDRLYSCEVCGRILVWEENGKVS